MLERAVRQSRRLLTLCLVLLALTAAAGVQARLFGPPFVQALPQTIALTDLPEQGQKMYRLILQGGPFKYEKDGAVFGNRERLLPQKKRGYYREYTVLTLGEHSRGARRIICGGFQPEQPDACWYSADHYASFSRIIP